MTAGIHTDCPVTHNVSSTQRSTWYTIGPREMFVKQMKVADPELPEGRARVDVPLEQSFSKELGCKLFLFLLHYFTL